MPVKPKAAINGSLNQLGELVQKAGIHLKLPDDSSAGKPPLKKKPMPSPLPPPVPSTCSEAEIFLGAMGGVQRASWRHNPPPLNKPLPAWPSDPEAENRKLMQAVIETDTPITIGDHPEYIEGWVGVAGKRFLPKLRNGIYSVQGQIDLHGLNQSEARIAVEEYIHRMARFRSCCIKIIHGRGINSPSDRATLKDSLQRWLSTRRMSHFVVAYASALSNDGGVGAVYVLLRRQQ
jgi:DNA-nicking Smr family endonuclease